MYRLGIIEESIDDREVLSVLKPYFISQHIENVPEDECPIWHINEYHVADDRIMGIADMLKQHIKETWDEMIEYGVNTANVDKCYLKTIPLHI